MLQVERLEAKYLAHATTLYLFRQERVTAQLYSYRRTVFLVFSDSNILLGVCHEECYDHGQLLCSVTHCNFTVTHTAVYFVLGCFKLKIHCTEYNACFY